MQPPDLPFPANEENRKKMEKFLKDFYAPSLFNKHQHQQKDLRPHAVFILAAVPLHWQEKVKEDIDHDVGL